MQYGTVQNLTEFLANRICEHVIPSPDRDNGQARSVAADIQAMQVSTDLLPGFGAYAICLTF